MNKYHAISFVDKDGIRWHSKGEFQRWMELRLLERGKVISGLERQVPFVLRADGGKPIGKVVLDFVYVEDGSIQYEDHKGVETPFSRWKYKHFAAQYGKEIRIHRKVARRRSILGVRKGP